jgi:hypothetical protein
MYRERQTQNQKRRILETLGKAKGIPERDQNKNTFQNTVAAAGDQYLTCNYRDCKEMSQEGDGKGCRKERRRERRDAHTVRGKGIKAGTTV